MDLKTLPTAPPGFAWVYNRLAKPWDGIPAQFDGVEYYFKPHECRLLSEVVAEFLYNQSIVSFDMKTNTGRRALSLQSKPDFGEPLDAPATDELIDRTSGDNPAGKGTGGLKTKAARVAVGSRT